MFNCYSVIEDKCKMILQSSAAVILLVHIIFLDWCNPKLATESLGISV